MQKMIRPEDRRTTIDAVHDALYDEIATLTLPPGAKLSEADIARRFGVSRQPVRDAFNRLAHKQLLRIRPQKATVVRGFSIRKIANARFIRAAIELEVLHHACATWDATAAATLREVLDQQHEAIASGGAAAFHEQDFVFHRTICHLAGQAMAFETIEDCKRSIDRLCVLSLGRENEVSTLIQDHEDIAAALIARDSAHAATAARRHFARLDDTIDDIHRQHAEFFEDDD